MGFIMKGLKVVIGLVVLFMVLGIIFGNHNTSTPASTTSQPTDTKTAYTRDGVNFISKERIDENIKVGFARPGDYKEVQVPLKTVVVDASVVSDNAQKQGDRITPTQQAPQTQAPKPKQTSTAADNSFAAINLHYIKGSGSYFGCVNQDDFDKLVRYLTEKDNSAFEKEFYYELSTGALTKFKNGEPVYLEDTAILSGVIQVRRPGESTRYWTVMEAITT